jgi:hypothetical protein
MLDLSCLVDVLALVLQRFSCPRNHAQEVGIGMQVEVVAAAGIGIQEVESGTGVMWSLSDWNHCLFFAVVRQWMWQWQVQ